MIITQVQASKLEKLIGSTNLQVYIARQPILDRHLNLYGYELLFRDGPENWFKAQDLSNAASSLIGTSSIWFDFTELVQGKRGFLNVTHDVMRSDHLLTVPSDYSVIEILETESPTEELLETCKFLKKQGYLIALDDFEYQPAWDDILKLIDIVKIDVLLTPLGKVAPLLKLLKSFHVRLLAEKVETQEVYDEAKDLGFDLFQGYFFARPQMIQTKRLHPGKANYLRLLSEINQPHLDFKKIGGVLSQDPSLSYGLLRFLNSSMFHFRTEIRSVHQAVVLLGEVQLKRWTNLLVFQQLGQEKADQLILQAAVRGKFCELMAQKKKGWLESEELFTGGLFSLMEALLDRPISEILDDVPLSKALKSSLIMQEASPLTSLLQAVKALETSDWEKFAISAKELGISQEVLYDAYGKSIRWAQSIFH